MTVSLQVPPELIGSSGLYNTSDPLLRRLRLEDQTGAPVTDIDRWFRFKDIVVLYAGSEKGERNIRELHSDLTTFAIREHKTCAVIYVSTDLDPACPARVLAQKPWLRMTFNDDSDFAPLVPIAEGKGVEVAEVSRGEEFVHAGEIEVGAETVKFGVEEYQHDYVRPLSRAAVTMTMNAYQTPCLAVYHIPSHSFVAKNVRPNAFSADRIERNLRMWKNGGSPSLSIIDVAWAMKIPLFLLALAIIYHLIVFVFGEEYNVIPKLMDSLNWRQRLAVGDQL